MDYTIYKLPTAEELNKNLVSKKYEFDLEKAGLEKSSLEKASLELSKCAQNIRHANNIGRDITICNFTTYYSTKLMKEHIEFQPGMSMYNVDFTNNWIIDWRKNKMNKFLNF